MPLTDRSVAFAGEAEAAAASQPDYNGGQVEATDLPNFTTVGKTFRIVTKDTVVLPCDVDNPGKWTIPLYCCKFVLITLSSVLFISVSRLYDKVAVVDELLSFLSFQHPLLCRFLSSSSSEMSSLHLPSFPFSLHSHHSHITVLRTTSVMTLVFS